MIKFIIVLMIAYLYKTDSELENYKFGGYACYKRLMLER